MKYGADDDSKLQIPPADVVEWVGWDKTMPNEFNKKVIVKSKDWYIARKEIGKELHVSSLDNLTVMRKDVYDQLNFRPSPTKIVGSL